MHLKSKRLNFNSFKGYQTHPNNQGGTQGPLISLDTLKEIIGSTANTQTAGIRTPNQHKGPQAVYKMSFM